MFALTVTECLSNSGNFNVKENPPKPRSCQIPVLTGLRLHYYYLIVIFLYNNQKCAKAHLQQCRNSNYFRGQNPRNPARFKVRGGGSLTREGRGASNAGEDGRGGQGRGEEAPKI